MANYGGSTTRVVHKTSGAGVEDVITLTAAESVIVTQRSGVSTIYYTTDNTPAVVAADNTCMVPASVGAFDQHRIRAGGRVQTDLAATDQYHPGGKTESAVVVRLVTATATDYTVEIVE